LVLTITDARAAGIGDLARDASGKDFSAALTAAVGGGGPRKSATACASAWRSCLGHLEAARDEFFHLDLG